MVIKIVDHGGSTCNKVNLASWAWFVIMIPLSVFSLISPTATGPISFLPLQGCWDLPAMCIGAVFIKSTVGYQQW